MKNQGIRFIGGLLICMFALGGCQSDVTLSKAARRGDTLVVSLGNADPNGEYSNLNSELIREPDVTAEVLDSGWATHPVKVRHVFRVYGDPTAVDAKARGRGQWMAVVDLVNPTGSGKPNLAIGEAALILKSPAFNEPQVVHTEIIAGDGSPHPFISQNEPVELGWDKLALVRPAKQALVSINGTLPPGVRLAGAQYHFSIPDVHTTDALFNRLEAATPAKLATDRQIHFEFSRTERDAPVGTDVVVVITSNEGVEQADLPAFNFAMFSDINAIASNPTYWQQHFSGAAYYDTQGQEIASLGQQVGESE